MSFGEPGTTVGSVDALSDDAATATGVSSGLPRAHAFGVVDVLLSVVVDDGHSPMLEVETSSEPHPERRGDSIFCSTFVSVTFFGERIFSAGSFTTGSDGLVFCGLFCSTFFFGLGLFAAGAGVGVGFSTTGFGAAAGSTGFGFATKPARFGFFVQAPVRIGPTGGGATAV